MQKIVIVGSGPAGYTAAIYAARANLAPTLYSGSLPGGLLTRTTEVENFPGFPDGVKGSDLVMNMLAQAEKFGTAIEYESITAFQLSDGGVQTLTLESGGTLQCEALILATGASPRYLGIPGEERLYNKGVSACATCDGAFFKDVPVAVFGGGDSAMEEATFLTKFASKVYLIHRRDQFRASKIMIERARANPKIEFILSSVAEEILGENAVEGVRLRHAVTGVERTLACKGCFAALGHIPNTTLLKGQLELDASGYIVVKDGTSQTSLAGVFAAGDCADPRYRQAINAAAAGCRAAMDAERYLEAR